MSLVLGGLEDFRGRSRSGCKAALSELDDSRLSRSLLLGLVIYASIPADGSSIGVIEIARINEVTPSMAHRYVSTLVTAGLVDRDPKTRRYRAASSTVGGTDG